MRRLLRALSRLGSLALLPLSVLPLAGTLPFVISAHAKYVRYYESPALRAPADVLSATARREFKPLAPFTGAIPVLAYHGINGHDDGYSVSQRTFAAQMQMLKLAGFQSISIAQYDRFQHGALAGVPPRPILITFDDGRLDSFRGADAVLAAEGFRATMFVITGRIAQHNPFYLTWSELHRMLDSGRWDVQPHAYQGHVQVAIDAKGDMRPFYAVRRYLHSTGVESFRSYQQRVASDLFALAAQFQAQGIPIHSMAVPYGDYGQQDVGNDPRIVPFTLSLLSSQFGSVFVQDDHNDPPYTAPTDGGPEKRWEARTGTTAAALYDWLAANDPAQPHPARQPAAPTSSGQGTE